MSIGGGSSASPRPADDRVTAPVLGSSEAARVRAPGPAARPTAAEPPLGKKARRTANKKARAEAKAAALAQQRAAKEALTVTGEAGVAAVRRVYKLGWAELSPLEKVWAATLGWKHKWQWENGAGDGVLCAACYAAHASPIRVDACHGAPHHMQQVE